jgi:hypothetical protein
MALRLGQSACSILRGQTGYRQSGTHRARRRRPAPSHSPPPAGAARTGRRIEHPGACALSRRVARPERGQLWGSAGGIRVPSSRPPTESTRGGRIAHPESIQAPLSSSPCGSRQVMIKLPAYRATCVSHSFVLVINHSFGGCPRPTQRVMLRSLRITGRRKKGGRPPPYYKRR